MIRKNKKGFTLVELLAVIVILGILMVISIPAITHWIDRSKVESIETQRKTLLMAGESYAQANTNFLPKTVGSFVEISASQLKEANYLNSDILNADKESCMAKSFVRIYKYDKTGYTYTAYIYCGNEERPEDVHVNPIIHIKFNGGNKVDDQYQDVNKSSVNITIDGNKATDGSSIGLTSYRYVISVNYDNNPNSSKVELFNSNDILAGGRAKIEVTKDLTSFENYTSITNFNVMVEAYNQDGGYTKVSSDSSFKDTTGPICGNIIGQPGENEWNKEWRTKKIGVECIDGDGSGCVKDVYYKTFSTQSEYGIITIKDNAGNTTDCTVRVHLDWTAPTLTIKAYKRNADGTKGSEVGTVTANNSGKTKELTSYTDGNGDDSWLNKAKFPYGIYYEVTASDAIKVQTGTYSENAKNLKKNASTVNTLTVKTTKTFTKTDKTINFSIVDEGFRKGKFVLSDSSGNTVTVNITAPIDRTNPVCGSFTNQARDDEWTNDASRTVSVACSDTISGCTDTSFSKKFTAEVENGNIPISDNAGNVINCLAKVHLDRTAPTLKIVAYKRNQNGTKGIEVANVTADNTTKTKNLNSYTGGNGTDSWLNNANFPYGIYYEVTTSDNHVLKSGVYSENASGIKKGGSGVDTLTEKISNSGEPTSFSIEEEGYRKGKYVLKDAAGNTATVNITAPIDRTNPIISASKSNIGSESGVKVTVTCTDAISGCTGLTETRKASKNYTISDAAGNISNVVSVSVESYSCNSHGCNPHSCNCEDCNPHPCNCVSCNCHECCHWAQFNYNTGKDECIEPCGLTCNTCCDTCYDSCCDTCYDTCYNTCYK